MLTYHDIGASSDEQWLELLNSNQVRRHLLQHPQFTSKSLQTWLQSKIEENKAPGCKVRAVQSDGELVGWCGIQREKGAYELAIVLSPRYWGHGREIFEQVTSWAREMGHKQLVAHLPRTRPQTRAIERLFGKPVGVSSIQGHEFNTFIIEI